jgi:hypothetical protein
MNTQELIETLFTNFKEFLKEKNKRYGDAVLNPLQIFSSTPASEQALNRLDDKLSRIKTARSQGKPLKKNDVSDVFGYLALFMINQGWLTFDELLD